jgi:excisionase family DNA binding protein
MVIMQITGEELHTLIQNAVERAITAMPAPRNTNPSERLTITQLATEYKICKATIHKLCRTGKLAYEKIGRKTLFQRADVDDCFNSGKRKLDKPFGTVYMARGRRRA